MLEPYYSDNLTKRQEGVIEHYIEVMGYDINKFHYVKSQEYLSDLFPIDIMIFEPTKDFNYYTIATVGLSEYLFPKFFTRVELSMVLPKNWKPILDKEEYAWAPDLLLDIAYQIVENNIGVQIGQVYLFNGENGETYSKETDAIGGIICLPEMFPFEMLEAKIEDSYTRFFQIMPVNKSDVNKIDKIGPKNFIKYDLHDSEKPLMVVPIKEKKLYGIDKIIKKNEDSLKGK